MAVESRPPLIILVGPTAVGKTSAAISLAIRSGAEIISADSRLFYRGMDIGTAKPTPHERQQVPHHLIDFLNPDESFSLSEFQASVYQTAAAIHRRGRIPLMVGGTGQYVRAITEGWTVPVQPPAPLLRAALERQAAAHGSPSLHRWLQQLDPEAAGTIDHRNLRRTVRALEVIFSTGRPFTSQRKSGAARFRTLILGLIRPRSELYEQIDCRIGRMFAEGLVDEVQALIEAGYSPALPALSAIGYRECIRLIRGEITQDEAIAQMKQRTRTLVRRQANWFKPDDPGIHWLQPEVDLEPVVRAFLEVE